MAAALLLADIETQAVRRDCLMVRAFLENVGTEAVGPGIVMARQVSPDGSMSSIEFFNPVALWPGGKNKVSQLLRGQVKELKFTTYRPVSGESIPLSGLIKRNALPWRLAENGQSFFAQVLLPIYNSVASRVERLKTMAKAVITSRR